MTKKYKIFVLTGTRADYGLLRPVLFRLKNIDQVELVLLVTGTHLSEKFGNTVNEIVEDGFSNIIEIPLPLEDDSKAGMVRATGVGCEKLAGVFEENKPDVLIVLGDRYEALSAAIAANFMGIQIAHLCGGDVTEGAVDDSIRHCITKLSSLHFPSCEESAQRIISMGENPDFVFSVGDTCIENCLNMELLSREELRKNIGFDNVSGDYCVVTFHPVTREDGTEVGQLNELIRAMDEFDEMSYIITMANADAGGRAINEIWKREGEKRDNWFVTESLGIVRYLSAVKYCRAVIGNSSSGIMEAPVLCVPTVNIGDRQKGRMMAKSVVCCRPEKKEIIRSMNQVLSEDYMKKLGEWKSPFGDGSTSERIVEIIMDYLTGNLI